VIPAGSLMVIGRNWGTVHRHSLDKLARIGCVHSTLVTYLIQLMRTTSNAINVGLARVGELLSQGEA